MRRRSSSQLPEKSSSISVLSSALLAVRMFAPIWISFEKLPSSRESWSESVVVAKEVRLLETVVVPCFVSVV